MKNIYKQLRNSSRLFKGVNVFRTRGGEWRALYMNKNGEWISDSSNTFRGIISIVDKERVRKTN